jgi:hypothetical protein
MVGSRRRVWLKKRKNPKQHSGDRSVSYTLQWKDEDGKERFQSLGKSISREEAERKRVAKELELNPIEAPVVVRVEAAAPAQLSVQREDIFNDGKRHHQLDLQIRVALPELGLAEIQSMQVPLEILPFLHLEPGETFRHALLLDFLEHAARYLERAGQDANGKEASTWRKRLIKYLDTAEDLVPSSTPEPTPIARDDGKYIDQFECRIGTVQVYKVHKDAKEKVWSEFDRTHYLSGVNNAAHYYIACFHGERVAFDSTLSQVGQARNCWREHRLIVKPQYRGNRIGPSLSECLAKHYLSIGKRFFSKTRNPKLGKYRDKSPLWRPTSSNHRKTEKGVFYSHEYVGPNPIPRPAPRKPERFNIPLQKDGVVYLGKPLSLLAKTFGFQRPHIKRLVVGRQTHVKGFTLVDEDIRPMAEKMLEELDRGTVKEIDVQSLRAALSIEEPQETDQVGNAEDGAPPMEAA